MLDTHRLQQIWTVFTQLMYVCLHRSLSPTAKRNGGVHTAEQQSASRPAVDAGGSLAGISSMTLSKARSRQTSNQTHNIVCAFVFQSFDDSLHTIRGSIPWMAPEMIKQTGHGRSADVWSVGATMIEMYTARYPWPPFSNNIAAMYHVATATEVS